MKRRSNLPVAIALLAIPSLVFAWVAAGMIAGRLELLAERAAAKDAALVESRVSAGLAASVERAKHAAETAVASGGVVLRVGTDEARTDGTLVKHELCHGIRSAEVIVTDAVEALDLLPDNDRRDTHFREQ